MKKFYGDGLHAHRLSTIYDYIVNLQSMVKLE